MIKANLIGIGLAIARGPTPPILPGIVLGNIATVKLAELRRFLFGNRPSCFTLGLISTYAF